MTSRGFRLVFLAALLAPVAAWAQAVVTGIVYNDGNQSSLSYYMQAIDAHDQPLPNIPVSLLSAGAELQTTTGPDGVYLFDNVAPGTYFVSPRLPGHDSTSNDCALRAPQAIRDGAVHIVTIGDSIGVRGGAHPYPYRLGWHFADLAEVTVDDIAVDGSTSWQWLPGADTGYFDQQLAPLLPTTDILTVTLTGDDASIYVEGMPPYDVQVILQRILQNPQYILDAVPNLLELFADVQAINPDLDIVFVIYPNFGNSTYIVNDIGQQWQPLASWAMHQILGIERRKTAAVPNIVLADMEAFFGNTWLDPYLVDEVHPNDAGAQLYADVIFRSLGGVVIDDDDASPADDDASPDNDVSPDDDDDDNRLFGFYAPDLVDDDDDDDDNDDNDDDDNDDNDNDNDNDDDDDDNDNDNDDDNDDNDDDSSPDDDDDNDDNDDDNDVSDDDATDDDASPLAGHGGGSNNGGCGC